MSYFSLRVLSTGRTHSNMTLILRCRFRYYSCTVLDSIHRGLAIEEWAKYQQYTSQRFDQNTPNVDKLNGGMRMERALGAFDMFMLHDNEGDLDEVRFAQYTLLQK